LALGQLVFASLTPSRFKPAKFASANFKPWPVLTLWNGGLQCRDALKVTVNFAGVVVAVPEGLEKTALY
jgi:hypothetical protein